MPTITEATYRAEIEWDKNGRPVMYVVGHGQITSPLDALEVARTAVQMIDEGPHEHVCAVYNLLDLTHAPSLVRFVRSSRFPSSQRTAHIVVGTHNTTLRLVSSLVAVMSGSRLRTLEICGSADEIEEAIRRWLALPEHMRTRTIRGF